MGRKVCATPGCPRYTHTTRCAEHTRDRDKARGSRQDRGYDAAHDRERARWQRILDSGKPLACANPTCKTPQLPVNPKHWHLGHAPDRTTWRGPEHPACNTSEAGQVRSSTPGG